MNYEDERAGLPEWQMSTDLTGHSLIEPCPDTPSTEFRIHLGLQPAGMLIAAVLKPLVRESSLLAPDFRSFKRQELTFAGLNLFLLGALLLTHVFFSSCFGSAPPVLFAVLAAGLAANAAELIWINRRQFLSPESIVTLTWVTIATNMTVAFALASLSYRQDIQYFALMIAPIFQAAFRLSFSATLLTVTVSDGLIFFWVWNYFRSHPPQELNEYIEAGTISAIYAIAGLLVWILVNHLRSKQTDLVRSLSELEEAKAKLLIEEKLAAVGRFSSAIAHEIRNPVAMISSALTTAFQLRPDSPESQEMFDIAAKEASRLEKLTTDFLAYARPRSPSKERCDITDSIAYVADICRGRAREMGVAVCSAGTDGLWAEADAGQLQQALLNLAMNAIEGSAPGGVVVLRGSRDGDRIRIDVENANGPIPAAAVARIFEPFFTTRPAGTGLGLAIARNIVLGHGGDLVLSCNRRDMIQFSIVLPVCSRETESS